MHIAPQVWRHLCFGFIAVAGIGMLRLACAEETLTPIPDYAHLAQPLVEQYCFDCHSGDAPEAGLSLEKINGGAKFQHHRKEWKKVLAQLRAGDMPPEDYDVPTDAERKQLTDWIEARLGEFNCDGEFDPGWITLRRLNRDQYRNTVRDLLGVDFDPHESFPPDALAFGFDNNADMLSLTPRLLEKYLDAAREISSRAVLSPESLMKPSYVIAHKRWKGGHYRSASTRSLTTESRIEFDYDFPTAGRYLLRAVVSGEQAGDEPVQMGFVDQHKVVKRVNVRTDKDETEVQQAELRIDGAGKRRIGVAFLNDFYIPESRDAEAQDRNLLVHRLEILGPIDTAMKSVPQGHARWFAEGPTPEEWRDGDWKPAVRRVLEPFLTHAYRRPPPSGEVDRLLQLVAKARQAGDSYERAMQLVVRVVLVSPRFLFIGNLDAGPPAREDKQIAYEVDEYELASRLSYFLWSSMPDEELLRLAAAGELRGQLKPQLGRMLRDRRAEQLASNFTGQWLGTRLLKTIEPDRDLFAQFDEGLASAMAREAEMVFAEVVRRDLPITSLLDADFTYVNGRLAEHYGFSGVKGNSFRRVPIAELPAASGVRGGLLTMAGVLAVTSNPNRTSPVKRGKWILGELLGAEPPPPPPTIPGLEESADPDHPTTLREQLASHRADPACAVCHDPMDPLGLALEQFDAIGQWRTEEHGQPIDARGELPGGKKIDGVKDLREEILHRRDDFRKCLTEKLLTYALGRGLEYYDECAVGAITNRLAENDDRISVLLLAIVESDPFQKRRLEQSQLEKK